MMTNKLPEWLKQGSLVEFAFCVGEVVDVAVSDKRIMVLVRSPKGIWRNHATEWLEYREGGIQPATRERAEREIELYRSYIEKMLVELNGLSQDWEKEAPVQEIIPA